MNNQLYFPNVNFLRAIAALMVVIYHVIEHTNWTSVALHWPTLTFRLGWLGVDLFFVISGFVIGLSAIKLHRENNGAFRKTFFRRRLARIVPLYVFTAALFLFLVDPTLFRGKVSNLLAHVGAHLAFIHSWFYKTHGSIDGPNWSVAVEMQFYVVAMLLCPALSKVKPWKILFWGIVLAWVSRFLALSWTLHRDNPYRTFVFATQVPGMADEFAFGIFLSRLFLDGTLHNLMNRWKSGRILLVGAAFLGGMGVLYLAIDIYSHHALYWNNVYMVTFWRTSIAISFAFFLALFCFLPDLTKYWIFRPLHYLGEISYGIYLWHVLVIVSLQRAVPPENHFLFLKLTLILTCILAAMSWHFFEKPIVQRFR